MFSQGRIRVFALCVADVICVCAVWAAVVLGYWLLGCLLDSVGVGTGIGRYSPSDYLVFWPVPFVFVFVNLIFDLYHGNWMYPAAPLPPVEEMRRLIGSSCLTHLGVIAALAFAFQTTEGYSRAVIVMSGAVVAFGAQSFRNWSRRLLHAIGMGQMSVLLAGSGSSAMEIATILHNDVYSGMRIVGYFDGVSRQDTSCEHNDLNMDFFNRLSIPRLGSLRDIVDVAKKRDIKILLACQDERIFRGQMEDLSRWFTYIEFLPTAQVFPVFGSKTVSFGGLCGLEMMNQGRMKVKRVQKCILDISLAMIAFVLLSPLFVLLPIIIKLTSKGPVFYRQNRLGKSGRPIRVWKFRSMYEDADDRLAKLLETDPEAADEWSRNFKLRHDPRITPFGRFLRKTSMDELPQLFNVFVGDMALIGPRPIVGGEISHYGDSYRIFSSVKPGITGLWQVSGRSDTDYAKRVALDRYYVLNWSLWMDIWILVRTVYAVLFMRGAR